MTQQITKDLIGKQIRIIEWYNGIGIRDYSKDGLIVTVEKVHGNTLNVKLKPGFTFSITSCDKWEMAEKTLSTLSVGDIVIRQSFLSGKSENKVLAVLAPGLYVLSQNDNFDSAYAIFTVYDLEENEYTIKDATPSAPREVTMAEVTEKFGENVVIKKEA